MQDFQQYLDTSAVELSQMIRQGGRHCDMLCQVGDFEAAANLREAVGYLNLALAAGRRVETKGGIKPLSGGK